MASTALAIPFCGSIQISYDPETLEYDGDPRVHARTATWSVDGYRDDETDEVVE